MDIDKGCLGLVNKDDLRCLEIRDASAKDAAERSARPGYENLRAAEIVGESGLVELGDLTTAQRREPDGDEL